MVKNQEIDDDSHVVGQKGSFELLQDYIGSGAFFSIVRDGWEDISCLSMEELLDLMDCIVQAVRYKYSM